MLRRSFKPTNDIVNGDFSKGTENWRTTGCTIATLENTLINTGDGSYSLPYIQQDVFTAGHRYYLRAKVRVTNNQATSMRIQVSDGSIYALNLSNPVQNKWYIGSNVGIAIDTPLRIRHVYVDNATAIGKVMEIKEVLAVDLTKILPADILALSDTDLTAWCDINLPVWFDGTLSGGVIGGIGGLQ